MNRNEKRTAALYQDLTLSERASMAVEALANHDMALADFIAETIPQRTYMQRDIGFTTKTTIALEIATLFGLEWFRHYALYLAATGAHARFAETDLQELGINPLQSIRESISRLIALEVLQERLCIELNLEQGTLAKIAKLPEFELEPLLILQDEYKSYLSKLEADFLPLAELAA